jgi:hypothetical protein
MNVAMSDSFKADSGQLPVRADRRLQVRTYLKIRIGIPKRANGAKHKNAPVFFRAIRQCIHDRACDAETESHQNRGRDLALHNRSLSQQAVLLFGY